MTIKHQPAVMSAGTFATFLNIRAEMFLGSMSPNQLAVTRTFEDWMVEFNRDLEKYISKSRNDGASRDQHKG